MRASPLPHAAAWILALSLTASRPSDASGAPSAGEPLLADDFAEASNWQKGESRRGEKPIAGDVDVEIAACRDDSRTGPFLRVRDRSPEDHWFWLHKRKASGAWDLSQAGTVTLQTRGDGVKSAIRFLVEDACGNVAYYTLENTPRAEWTRHSLDLTRATPFRTVGVVNWCAVRHLGVRTDAGHDYTFDLDDLRVDLGAARPVTAADLERPPRPPSLAATPIGYLAPAGSSPSAESIVGINLTGHEDAADLDRIARAGVKWAKLSCRGPTDGSSPTDRIVDGLRARGIAIVGQLPQTLQWSKDLFPGVKGAPGDRVPITYGREATAWFGRHVRDTAEHFKGRIRTWEIGNEPDIAKFWMPAPDPAAFARFVIETSNILKTVDSGNRVISGGVCGFWAEDFSQARAFLTTFLETGAGRHIDILGLHPYRPWPELGAPGMAQRAVADAVRGLMARFGPVLPLWDTEWQITGAVDRAEVPFATDLYEAKGMLRKYLVEADAGFAHMNWQIAKARSTLDHPGQIFTADGRPTAKYMTLCHAGALFSKIAGPTHVPVQVTDCASRPALVILSQHRFDTPAALRDWSASAGTMSHAAPPSAARGTLRLSGTGRARIDTVARWRPIFGTTFLEARGALTGDGCEVRILPTPRGGLGEDLPSPPQSTRPLSTRPTATPFCFRFAVGPDWHDFGLCIELPKGGSAFLDEVTVSCALPPVPEIASLGFTLRGSPVPALFLWIPEKPLPQQRLRAVDIAIRGMPDADLVLLDTLTGEVRPLGARSRPAAETLFARLPLCDYPLAIAPRDAFPVVGFPGWLDAFADADDVVNRSFRDRTADFYLREFWAVAFHLAETAEATDARLGALRRVRSLWRRFPATPRDVVIRPGAPSRVRLCPGRDSWHDSVTNVGSRHVNRFFHALDDADRRATVHAVRLAGRPLPERSWADSPDNAFTWFVLRRQAQPSEVFIVMPEGTPLDAGAVEIDLSLPIRARAIALVTPDTRTRCIAYWNEPVPDPGGAVCTLEPDGARDDWMLGAALVDPRAGIVRGRVDVEGNGGGRVMLRVPPAPQPILVVPAPCLQAVMETLAAP